jgi:hypothetical protein
MSARVIWQPQQLTARLHAATRSAAYDFARTARARSPVKTSISVRQVGPDAYSLQPRGLGVIFEGGARPHEVAPVKKTVLRLADGRYVTGGVTHPGMKARPFMRPLLPAWPAMYRRRAAAAISGGIGAIRGLVD